MAKRGRKTNKKETTKAKDPKGYLDSNKDNFTDYKVIKGNKITMQGVSGQVYAIPVDSKGNAGQGRLLKAGENHEFEGASHVIEVPEVAMAELGLNTNPTDPNKPNVNQPQPFGAQQFNLNDPASDLYFGQQQQINTGQPADLNSPSSALQYNAPVASQSQGQSLTDNVTTGDNYFSSVDELSKFDFTQGQYSPELSSNRSLTNNLDNKLTQEGQTSLDPKVDNTLEDTEKIQFDNPYGGVDIPTAAQTLGASLSYDGDQGGANTARGVASGLKLLTGLGRNVASGYGQNKRNQYLTEEENRKQQKANQGQTESLQQGGNITDRDLLSINDSTGIDFNAESANSLFTQVPNEVQGEQPSSVDFGKYKDVGYFNTGEMQNGKRVIYNTPQNPMNYADNKSNALDYLRGLNGDNIDFQYRDNSQISNHNRNNNQTSNHNEVASRKKGGEVTAAELLTGNVATGGDPNAPHNVEVEGGEHIKDNQSGQVQEVMGKKHSQGGEKMNLEDHKVLSDFTPIGGELAKRYGDEYDVKVKAKDSYATVMDKILKKTGYKSITEELTSTIEKTEKEQEAAKDRDSEATTGINMQFLSGKINDLSSELEPLEKMKSNVFETLFNDQQASKPKADIEQELTEFEDGGDTSFNKDVSRERFIQLANTARQLGYEGNINPNAENLDAEAAKLQEYMVKNHPDVVTEYAKRNRITAKGLGTLKTNSPELFQQAGLDINKQPAEYTDEELAQLSTVAQESGAVDNEFWLNQFNDGLFRYRAPHTTVSDSPSPTGGDNGLTEKLFPFMQNSDIKPYSGTPSSNGDIPTTEEDKGKNEGNGRRTALLPDQSILPPSSMQPHRLGEISPREAEAKLISPNAQIEELNRQSLSARRSIDSLPDTQRRAALAQLNAQTQQSINKVMSQTNRANAQIEGQNEERNIQRGTRADILNERAANLHEKNQLLAKDNTETDIRNYFNAQNKKQVANFNTINNMNLTNAMYDNFQYDGNGSIIQTGKAPDLNKLAEYYIATGMTKEEADLKVKEAEKKAKEAKKTAASTAKRGRKTK